MFNPSLSPDLKSLTVSINEPDPQLLVKIFNQLFEKSENTLLKMGAKEPFYRAAKEGKPAVIFAREDYFSSALHEIAHWTIAGLERRKLDDFGYWYEPEGRSEKQQKEFESVEVKPQAIEWLLSMACNHPFHFSADNLSRSLDASEEFTTSVKLQAAEYLNNSSMPDRASLLFKKLKQQYRNGRQVELLAEAC